MKDIKTMENKPLIGIRSKCCMGRVCKFWNERNAGREEWFECQTCGEECEFDEEPTPSQPPPMKDIQDKENLWSEVVKDRIYNVASLSPNAMKDIEFIFKEALSTTEQRVRDEMEDIKKGQRWRLGYQTGYDEAEQRVREEVRELIEMDRDTYQLHNCIDGDRCFICHEKNIRDGIIQSLSPTQDNPPSNIV